MMNNTHTLTSAAFHRRLSVGAWTITLDRSPKRICKRVVDFAVGARWAALGVLFTSAAILYTAL